jgi:hypothetical protein
LNDLALPKTERTTQRATLAKQVATRIAMNWPLCRPALIYAAASDFEPDGKQVAGAPPRSF